MTRRPRGAPTRAGRRAVLARAAGLAAAGLAIDAAGRGRLLAAVQRAAPAVDWLWSGAITSGSARIRARVTIDGPVRLHPDAGEWIRRRAAHRRADGTAVDRRRPHLRRRRPAARHRLPLHHRDGGRPRRTHRSVPHLRRRAVLVRVRLRLVRVDRVQQRGLRRHPPPPPAFLSAPRRLPLRQHRGRRSVALPRRIQPRAPLAEPVGALSRDADCLHLRRPRLRPRRFRWHVGDEGGGAARLPRAGAALSAAAVGGTGRRAWRRIRSGPSRRRSRSGGRASSSPTRARSERRGMRATPATARCSAHRSGSGWSTS